MGRALILLEKTEAGTRLVRLLGASVHNLGAEVVVAPEEPQGKLPFDEGADEHDLEPQAD